MTAVGLVTKLRALFDINLDIAVLFERPTIAGLSEAIDMLVITNQSTSSSSGAREEFNL